MKPRIAIPVPHSQKPDYNQRCLPYYRHAIEASGGEAVEIPLNASPEEVARLITDCQGVLLPGSPADVDPQKFGETRQPETNDADPLRDNADELLLQDAYNMRKPVFGICYGLQSLNVWRTGSLVQHIVSPEIDHAIGSKVAVAHTVTVDPKSKIAKIVGPVEHDLKHVPVNSSHHQSADVVGDGLRVVARSEDETIEAVEGTNPEHFVLAVQWHPERTFDTDAASQALFKSFVEEARKYKPKPLASV
jgi:putative glutamine amidotransferase